MAAPLIVLWLDVRSVVVPVCCADHWRQTASSVWNCSKPLPLPRNPNTLGPVGIDAHAPRASAAPTETTANLGDVHFISGCLRRRRFPPIGRPDITPHNKLLHTADLAPQ